MQPEAIEDMARIRRPGAGAEYAEFLAADSPGRIFRARGALENFGDSAQRVVARAVAEVVVDTL